MSRRRIITAAGFVAVTVLVAGCAHLRSWATGLPPTVEVTTSPGLDMAVVHGVGVVVLSTEALTVVERDALGRRLADATEAALATQGYPVRAGGLGRRVGISEEGVALAVARDLGLDHLVVVTVAELTESAERDWETGWTSYRVRYAATVRLIACAAAAPVWMGSASGIAEGVGGGSGQAVATEAVRAILARFPAR